MKRQRIFIAVTLEDKTCEELGKIQGVLREGSRGKVRWVSPGGLHLTLKFLGDVAEEDLPRIYEAARLAAVSRRPFEICLSGLGVFPNLASPRIIWIGVKTGREELHSLTYDLETELFRIGYPREKRGFTPHLTLGRVKESNEGLGRLIDTYDLSGKQTSIEILVEKIAVMKSELRPDGAVYTTLKEFKLTGE